MNNVNSLIDDNHLLVSSENRFYAAIRSENLQAVQELATDTPGLVHNRTQRQDTPLHIGIKSEGVVEKLLELGADVNARDRNGKTPLHMASEQHLMPIIKALLRHGAWINAGDVQLRTPLHLISGPSLSEDENIEGIRFLLEHGADPNAADNQGDRPLHWYRMEKSLGIKYLVQYGADLNARNNQGMTPLQSCATEWPNPFSLLIRLGADIMARDENGWTPLHFAVATADCETRNVKLLFQSGADPNAQDKEGQTPLHLAAAYNTIKSVRLLIDNRADVNARDGEDKTPLWRARFGPFQQDDPDFNLNNQSYARALKRLARLLEQNGAIL